MAPPVPLEEEDEELLDDLEEEEEDDGTEASPEAYAIAETRIEALKHFELRIVADFIDWVPTFVDAISKGVFDGPELKAIMQAGFARRDAVMGKKGGKLPPAKPTSTFAGAVLGENGWQINPVNFEARTISFGNKRYAKVDMIGKVVRTSSTTGQWYLRNLLVKIISVGTTYMTVSMMDNPQDVYPTSTELAKKEVVAGTHYKLLFSNVQHIFG